MSTRGALDPDTIGRWVDSAEPGAQEVYAWGDPDFPRALPGVKLAVRLVGEGKISCFARSVSPGRREYVMRRVAQRARAEAKATGDFYYGPNSPTGVVLERLRLEAQSGLPCSTNDELDDLLLQRGFTEPSASYLVRCLAKRYLIRVELRGPGQRRRVTIIATGAQTAMERG